MTIELARPTDFRLAFEPRDQTEARVLAKVAVESKFFAVRTEPEALVILMTGRELGLSAMQSLRGIYIVQGRPVLSSDTIVAVIMMSGRCEYWQILENTAERCSIETKRKGAPSPVRKTWTAEDAKRAGLWSKDIWKSYPDEMLRHRCAAMLGRAVYSDVLLGCYVQGEIEAEAEIVPQPVAPPQPTKPTTDRFGQPPERIIEDRAQHGSPLLLEQAAAIWHDHLADMTTDEQASAFEYLRSETLLKSADMQRAIAFERWRLDVTKAHSVEELEAIYKDAKASTEASHSPWGKKTAADALAQLVRLCADRKKKILPPQPPNGGGAPKPETNGLAEQLVQATDAVLEAGGVTLGAGPKAADELPETQLRGKLAECTALPHLFNALFKHGPELGLSPDDGKRIAADRLVELGKDHMSAVNMVASEIRQRGWKASKKAA
jgi:hypothetical protein